MRAHFPLLLAAALAGCGSEPDQPAANQAVQAVPAQAQQKAPEPKQRLALCQEDLKRWTEGGMVALDAAGKPSVRRDRWDGMSPVGRNDITEILACIQSDGAPGEQQVIIIDAGNGKELDRVATPNTLHMP